MLPPRLQPAAKRIYRRLPDLWTEALDLGLRRLRPSHRAPGRLDVMTSFGGPNLDVIQVMLRSLSDAHPHDQIVFWLLELRATQAQTQALDVFCRRLGNVTLNSVKLSNRTDFDRMREAGGKPDSARFLWLAAHLHLPAQIDRVIYLDALDIVVSGDLMPLLRHPCLGQYVAACRELPHRPPLLTGPACATVRPHDTLRRMAQGLFNSGSMVLDLNRMRRDIADMGAYVATAEWAGAQGLRFGDQGLFSLTHGSRYARIHDRWNHRFHDEPEGRTMPQPAVVHYAGTMPKPFEWRLTPAQERMVSAHLARSGLPELVLNRVQRIRPAQFPYHHRWWAVCARTPVHDRIAPIAARRATEALAQVGLVAD